MNPDLIHVYQEQVTDLKQFLQAKQQEKQKKKDKQKEQQKGKDLLKRN
ncbi:10986_t:CDS:2 [Ambispora gerdemannii]|uniref:10986_t:CDS:1 n=1 Tax=Ambispora gerdemannii TaxID=144530 RepID=A0A9N9FEL2_9GLOM|nr:10986_t:CDS:2 [Ambispora gerdemannii]